MITRYPPGKPGKGKLGTGGKPGTGGKFGIGGNPGTDGIGKGVETPPFDLYILTIGGGAEMIGGGKMTGGGNLRIGKMTGRLQHRGRQQWGRPQLLSTCSIARSIVATSNTRRDECVKVSNFIVDK